MFRRKVFCTAGDRNWMDTEDEHELSDSQARLEDAAESTRASTLATRRRRKFLEAEDIKNNEREGAKCRNFVRRKSFRKEARKVKREWEARTGGSAKRLSDQPVVKKFCINHRSWRRWRRKGGGSANSLRAKLRRSGGSLGEQAERFREQRSRGELAEERIGDYSGLCSMRQRDDGEE